MKPFFTSFLGALCALAVAGFLAVGGFFLIILVIVSSLTNTVKVGEHSALCISLSGVIDERPGDPEIAVSGMSLVGVEGAQGLSQVVGAIDHAATNDFIEGIYIDCRGASAGVATLQSIRQAIQRFKKRAPNKWVYAYGDSYSQGDYLVASVADSVFINPVGELDLHGLSSQTMYFKDLLDKLGVDVQVVKVGTYKSAVEPYTRSDMSEANREQQELFLGNIWQSLSDSIAASRHITPQKVRELADKFIFADATKQYQQYGLVDKLQYRRDLEERFDDEELTLVTPAQYCANFNIAQTNGGDGPTIAVVYAYGEITEDGDEGITSEEYVPLILGLADDEEIDGLVLRVNSGGGSAFASEQIWDAVEQYKVRTKKPVYVSMGDYAASGGYYISCGADKIYAQTGTLTGSIGIFGMIPNVQGLTKDKLGINTATVSTSASGAFPNIFEPMTPLQAGAMQGYVDRGYELFTKRVAQGRHMVQDSVKLIAEGRVWDGYQAKKLGLVDQIGTLQDAVRDMAKKLGSDSYTVCALPVLEQSVWDVAMSLADDGRRALVDKMLGDEREVINVISRVRNMSTLQCRMEHITLR